MMTQPFLFIINPERIPKGSRRYKRKLSYRDMETSLMNFVLDIATILFTEITKYFAEHPFQSIIPYFSTRFPRGFNRFISIITKIECCTIHMT
jgi:hypothetical protein